MSLRAPETKSRDIPPDIRDYIRDLCLTLEQEFDKVEDALNADVNLVYESFITITADYSAGQRSNILVDTSSGNITITLPKALEVKRAVYYIKKTTTDANTLTVEAEGGSLIDGAATYVTSATNLPSIRLFSDGDNYWIL